MGRALWASVMTRDFTSEIRSYWKVFNKEVRKFALF